LFVGIGASLLSPLTVAGFGPDVQVDIGLNIAFMITIAYVRRFPHWDGLK
jgi:hypothetical protein